MRNLHTQWVVLQERNTEFLAPEPLMMGRTLVCLLFQKETLSLSSKSVHSTGVLVKIVWDNKGSQWLFAWCAGTRDTMKNYLTTTTKMYFKNRSNRWDGSLWPHESIELRSLKTATYWLLVFANKIGSQHCRVCSFTYCLWPLLCQHSKMK